MRRVSPKVRKRVDFVGKRGIVCLILLTFINLIVAVCSGYCGSGTEFKWSSFLRWDAKWDGVFLLLMLLCARLTSERPVADLCIDQPKIPSIRINNHVQQSTS